VLAGAPASGVPAAGDYFHRTWRLEDGLSDNSVNTVLQDPRGYIWFASLFGLSRFDGRKFEEFPLPAELREAGENIRALAQEDPSTLVLLPSSGGVIRFRAGHFSRHPCDAAVRGRELLQLFVAPDHALWLSDGRGAILRWQDGALLAFNEPEILRDRQGEGFSAAADGQGRIWIAEGAYLGIFDHGQLNRYPGRLGTGLVIAPTRAGGIWISTAERLLEWADGRATVRAEGSRWTPTRDIPQRLYEDHAGVLWIATRRSGLYQFSGGQVRSVPTDQKILSWITEDAEQGIWVASKDGGVTRLQRQRFVTVRPHPDQTDAGSTSVFEDASGAVWCANRDGGVFRFAGGRVEPVANPPGEPVIFANAVSPDRTGNVWVGAGSGLYRITPDRPLALQPFAPDLVRIHALLLTRGGDLWISANYNRLVRLRQGQFRAFTAQDGYSGKPVAAMAETADGTLWIAADNELCAYVNGRFVPPPSYRPPFPRERIAALYGDAAGALWIGTSRGLLRFKDNQLTAYDQGRGLPNERIEQILEDGHGILWFNSRQGFFRVPRADLEAVAAGRRARVVADTFGPEEGLIGETPIFNCLPDAWRGGGDRLWFCTQMGVIGIDAAAEPRAAPPPAVYIDRAVVDGQPADPARLELSTGQHRLGFFFSSPSFAAPEKMRLRYRLLGFDRDWIETVSDQEADYADLPAGRYVLQVGASDANGNWGEAAGATLAFAVRPLWWETWWAHALELALFAAAIAGLARYASHRLLRRRLREIERDHALEKERARIARDLHDELGGSLTRIGLLADRLRRRAGSSFLAAEISQLTRQTVQLAGELDSIVWTVNPRNNSLDRFARFVRQFALRFFSETEIRCTVLGVEGIPATPIPPEVQHQLVNAIKEALNNVLKHSQATQVAVELDFSPPLLTTTVRDDGVGFDPQAVEHSERNGLTNLQGRLKEIGGALSIHSGTGRGTELSWRVPLAGAPAGRPAIPASLP
jgi:signal transduction histidine kinase/ligand-binding sensor domain-containing protein